MEHDGLPIGWDTTHYVGGAIIVAVQGPASLVAQQGLYDIMYQFIEGLFVWAGVPGLTLELFLPIILAASIPYLLGKLSILHLDRNTSLAIVLSAPAWYAIYRLQADLHANLLALVLFLSALGLMSRQTSLRSPRCAIGLGLIALASFTHIESTLFFVFVTFVSSIRPPRFFDLRVVLVQILVVAPAALLYLAHLSQVLFASGGTLDFSAPEDAATWLITLGPLLPLCILGLAATLFRPQERLERFVSVWGIAAVAVGLSQYLSPQTVIFAQRAVLLFPTPILSGIGFRRLVIIATRVRITIPHVRFGKPALTGSLLLILALSWAITSVNSVANEKIFISSGAYQQLRWVSSNVKFSNTPIFLFNDVDEYAGGLAQLYDNWVSATVGPHLSYVGLVDYLVRVEETPYFSTVSQTISSEFIQQIRNSGITTTNALMQHPIILMGDFYRPYPLPTYTSSLFMQVSPGIFIANNSLLHLMNNVTLPLYVTFGPHSGDWYGDPSNWVESHNAYEVYDAITPVVQASFKIGIQSTGTFAFGLRYWNGSGNNLTVSVDGGAIGIVAYNNTNIPAIRSFQGISLVSGIHTLTITIANSPASARYASLDYVTWAGS